MPMPMASAAIYHNIQCLAAALVCHLSLETGPSAARGGHQCIFHAEVFGGGLHNLECPEGLALPSATRSPRCPAFPKN